MRSIVVALVAIVGAVIGAAPASAQSDERAQPSGPWHINWDDARCLAVRPYTYKRRNIDLALQPSPLTGTTELSLLVDSRASQVGTVERAWLAFPGHAPLKTRLLRWGTQDGKHTIFRINLSAGNMATMVDAPWLTVEGEDYKVTLTMQALRGVEQNLAACSKDLLNAWGGVSADGDMARSPPVPLNSPSTWVTPDDYPTGAVADNRSGAVTFRLMVDRNGAVADCVIDSSSGQPDLDVETCGLIRQRARFKPAVDKDGKPVASMYKNTVKWILG